MLTKEELYGELHEMLETIGPMQKEIRRADYSGLNLDKMIPIVKVLTKLQELDDALCELERSRFE